MKTLKGLFTKENAIIFVVIVVALVALELAGYGTGALADRARELRSDNSEGV